MGALMLASALDSLQNINHMRSFSSIYVVYSDCVQQRPVKKKKKKKETV